MAHFYKYSTIGTSHIHRELPCQDSVKTVSFESGWVCCIADGMGSYKHSGEWAHYLTRHMPDFVYHYFDCLYSLSRDEVLKILAEKIKSLVSAFVSEYSYSEDDFKSTFIIVAADAEERLLVIHQGDGAVIGIPSADAEFCSLISSPDNLIQEDGQIDFRITYPINAVTDEKCLEHVRIFRGDIRSFRGIMLGSDGGVDGFFDGPFFDSRFSNQVMVSVLENKLSLEDFYTQIQKMRHITDDFTIVVIDLEIPSEYDGTETCREDVALDQNDFISEMKRGRKGGTKNQAKLRKGKKDLCCENKKSGENNFFNQKYIYMVVTIVVLSCLLVGATLGSVFYLKKQINIMESNIIEQEKALKEFDHQLKAMELNIDSYHGGGLLNPD